MRGMFGVGVILGLSGIGISGCAMESDARYVYQDGEFGVVAIPSNTPLGPNHYRQQAEALMAQHFPDGYEIVRAEEVVEGSRTLSVGRTGSTEVAPQVAPHLLALLRVGASTTRNQSDTMNLRESRIIYKKADPLAPPGTPGRFAADSTLTPTCYRDPNTESVKKGEMAGAAQAKKEPQTARADAPRACE